MKTVAEIKKWLENEIQSLEGNYGDRLHGAETSAERNAIATYDCYKTVLEFIGCPTLYWVSAIIQDKGDSKPWLLAVSEGELSLERAKAAIDFIKKNHTVLSAWIDTFNENKVKETVFHECYIDAFGCISKL